MLTARATQYDPGYKALLLVVPRGCSGAVVLKVLNYSHLWPIFMAVAADAAAHLIPLRRRDDFGVMLAGLLHR